MFFIIIPMCCCIFIFMNILFIETFISFLGINISDIYEKSKLDRMILYELVPRA